MFTIKFYKFKDNGSEVQTSISAPHYEVVSSDGMHFVIVYKDFTCTNGVEYPVCKKDGDKGYDVCFVENEAGKTIDTIRSH